MSRERCARRQGCGLSNLVSTMCMIIIIAGHIPSRAARHDVLVEKCMNWRTVAGRGRPIGRRNDMKGVAAAMLGMRHVMLVCEVNGGCKGKW